MTNGILTEVYESGSSRVADADAIAEDGFEHLDEASRPRVKSALFAYFTARSRTKALWKS